MGAINLGNVRGAKGDKGDTGSTGATGATGAKGDKGDPGACIHAVISTDANIIVTATDPQNPTIALRNDFVDLESSKSGYQNINPLFSLSTNAGFELIEALSNVEIVKNVTSPGGSGSLKVTGFGGFSVFSDKFIPVDAVAPYRYEYELLNPTTNANTSIKSYLFTSSYDAELLLHSPSCHLLIGTAVILARNLEVGDTALYALTAGMTLGAATYNRRFIGWKKQPDSSYRYIGNNGAGKTYNAQGYTRLLSAENIWANTAGAFQQAYVVTASDIASGKWAGVTEGQTVYKTTLTMPVNTTTFWFLSDIRAYGVTMAAGDMIAGGSGGNAYNYLEVVTTPKSNNWQVAASPWVKGLDASGISIGWPEAKYIRIGAGFMHPAGVGYNTSDVLYVGKFGLKKVEPTILLGALMDATGSYGSPGNSLKNVAGLPVWSA